MNNQVSLNKVIALVALVLVLGALAVLFFTLVLPRIFGDDFEINLGEMPYAVREEVLDSELYDEFISSIDNAEALGGEIAIVSVLNAELEAAHLAGTEKMWEAFSLDVLNGQYSKISQEPTYFFLYGLFNHGSSTIYMYTGRPGKIIPGQGAYNTSLYVRNNDGVEARIADNESYDKPYMLTRIRSPKPSVNRDDFLYISQSWNQSAREPSIEDVNSWSVSVGHGLLSGNATTTLFANGFGAHWILSGEYIVYLKSDGVYAKKYVRGNNHLNEGEMLLQQFPYGYGYWAGFHMDVSNDGKYLLISNPRSIDEGNATIDILKLEKTDSTATPVIMRLVYRMPLPPGSNAYWPLFSPGNRFISLQSRSYVDGKENNGIIIFDLVDRQVVKTIDFNDFYFDRSFNTDWLPYLDL